METYLELHTNQLIEVLREIDYRLPLPLGFGLLIAAGSLRCGGSGCRRRHLEDFLPVSWEWMAPCYDFLPYANDTSHTTPRRSMGSTSRAQLCALWCQRNSPLRHELNSLRRETHRNRDTDSTTAMVCHCQVCRSKVTQRPDLEIIENGITDDERTNAPLLQKSFFIFLLVCLRSKAEG